MLNDSNIEGGDFFMDDANGAMNADGRSFPVMLQPEGPTSSGSSSSGPSTWIDTDVLLWNLQGFEVPALVTTSPSNTSRENAGVLGQPRTSIMTGDERYNGDWAPGLRLRVGTWLGECKVDGIEASVLALDTLSTSFSASSSATPILARPFMNVQPGSVGQDAELIAFPKSLSGNVFVSAETEFGAAEVLYRRSVVRDPVDYLDFVAGWRYLRLNDNLTFQDSKTALNGDGGLVVGTTLSESDVFETQNIFNGLNVGVAAGRQWGRFNFEINGKLAFGATHSRLNIDGLAVITIPTAGGSQTTIVPAGLLAQQTNIGIHDAYSFAMVPELNVAAGFHVTRCLKATLGYSFLYWSTVARPGDQIDTSLNLSQLDATGLVGPARPRVNWISSGIWAQGLNAGLELQF